MKRYVYPSKIKGTIKAPPSKSEMQRAVAAALLATGESLILNPCFSDDSIAALDMIKKMGAKVKKSSELVIIKGGLDIKDEIRTEAAGNAASRVAAIPVVREALLARQRAFREPPGLVADGRDMGTVVFPDAALKIFLTASPEERARRRYNQLIEKGLDANLSHLVAAIAERDQRDANRSVAPLVPAQDAEVIDTSELDIEQTVARVQALVRERLGL